MSGEPTKEEVLEQLRKHGNRHDLDDDTNGLRDFAWPEPKRGELLEARLPKPIVPGFVYETGLHALTGGVKSGKTVLAEQLGACVSTGQAFLGRPVSKKNVLYIGGEPSAYMLMPYLRSICTNVGLEMPKLQDELTFVTYTRECGRVSIDLTKAAHRAEVARRVRDGGYGLVIFDTLYSFVALKPSEYELMSPVFLALAQDAQETGAAYLELDHQNRSVATGEVEMPAAMSGFGSVGKGGACNMIASLNRRGTTWTLKVEGHYPAWSEPVRYRQPDPDHPEKVGCVVTTVAEKAGVDLPKLARLFVEYGERTESENRPHFASQAKLKGAIHLAAWSNNNNEIQELAKAIERLFAVRHDAAPVKRGNKPVWLYDGPRKAIQYVWVATADLTNEDTDAAS